MALFPGGSPRAAGVALALVLVLPSYWSLSLTLRRSNTQFFGAFVGGVLGRMAGLGLGGVIVWSHARAALIPFVLSAVIGLMGLSFIELFFIGRQNRLPI